MTDRPVLSQHAAHRDDIADLVTRRPLPGPGLSSVDPFLFLNHHGPQTYASDNQGLPFGPHPHRGFETVTFILKGSLSHSDTGGHESVIDAGGVQWMTAGKGLVHAELSPDDFKRDGGPLEILQLWVNLPRDLKMTAPRYTGLQRGDIPVISLGEGVEAELVSGMLGDDEGPIASLTGVMMSVLRLLAGATARLPAPEGRNVFFYVVSGTLTSSGETLAEHRLVRFGEGDAVAVAAETDAVILYGHADPIGEPVVSYGPFVMNTEAEIRQAFADYRAGAFERAAEVA